MSKFCVIMALAISLGGCAAGQFASICSAPQGAPQATGNCGNAECTAAAPESSGTQALAGIAAGAVTWVGCKLSG